MVHADCAKFCYAARGNFAFGASVRKSELVTWAVEQDPVRVGRMMAGEYSATLEFQHQKALRLFDKGDGTDAWVKVIETLNAHVGPDGKSAPIRVQVFSKNPAFLRQVPAMNLRMLSADKSNMEVVRANPDLPVAFVYSDGSQVAFLNEIKDRVQVILPVKQGVKLLDQQKINALILITAAAWSLTISFILVPHLGIYGAAIATVSACLCAAASSYAIARKKLGLKLCILHAGWPWRS